MTVSSTTLRKLLSQWYIFWFGDLFLHDLQYIMPNAHGCYNWKRVFIWHPVITVSDKVIWLQHTYKRRVRYCYSRGIHHDRNQYGDSFDMITNKFSRAELEWQQISK